MIGFCFVNAEFLRDDTKEVVLDTSTNLIWQDDSNVSNEDYKKNWSDAIAYCEASTLGEYDDWRLPNHNELFMIADRSKYNPSLSQVFINSGPRYWTATTSPRSTGYAYRIEFDIGWSKIRVKSETWNVRCVR